jgi:hypothetical protein
MKIYNISIMVFFYFVLIVGCNSSKRIIYDNIQNDINLGISYLGKPVPSKFNRINETIYRNNKMFLNVENGIVISSGINEEYNNSDKADNFYSLYCNYFHSNWTFFQRDLHCDVFFKNNIYIVCGRPSFNEDDRLLVISFILYSKEYYDSLLEKAIGG